MDIKNNYLLAPITTMGVGGNAKYFVEVNSSNELKESLIFAEENKLDIFLLAGGANIIVSDNGFDGIVIKINSIGREVLSEDESRAKLKVQAGEVLDEVIQWAMENGWHGMENLSLVPGSVGGHVIQNAGCYGVEASDYVESVEVYDRETGEFFDMPNEECAFRYRSSRFNMEDKGRFIILSVTLDLKKKMDPIITYKDLKKRFEGKPVPTFEELRSAIISIRKGKGYDIRTHKSVGSFFSNLLLTDGEIEKLKERIRSIKGETFMNRFQDELDMFFKKGEKDLSNKGGKRKLPTGFLLDKVLGLKGYDAGKVKLWDKHSQMILNKGDAKAGDVMKLFRYVRQKMFRELGVVVVNEPEFVGFTEKELEYYFEL